MAYATAKSMDANVIPVVDITELRDGTNPREVAKQLHAASQGLGFIYVKGHGIPTAAIEAARSAAYQFFRASDEQKSTVTISARHRGWLSQGQSKMTDDAPADLKESFLWGYQDEHGHTVQDHPLRGTNQWPEFVPALENSAVEYFEYAHDVAHHLMRGFAIGLELAEDFFLQQVQRPLSRASFVYYPAQPADSSENQFGVAPHTDFGVLTVLCQDDTGGLQVQDVHGDWIHAPPIEDTLIVNVGDLLCRWTDGEYKSTPHRVVNSSGRERMSLVLAFDPEPDTPIDATHVFGANHQPKEPPISCGDYLIWRFGKAFSYREADS
ncbi:hypothetical protein AB833_10270 [Chromatiales bacterium (ex Bugula neritina AB1)]|nr:hypothetical protein AB833_10270 [Chromatiales bacterium (ex Bugula neritina AB1)]